MRQATQNLDVGLIPRRAGDALDRPLNEGERSAMISAAEQKISELFDVLRIDHRHDQNTRETPGRVARSLVDEILGGRYMPPPVITEFENAEQYDELIVTGPIDVRSMCAHHMLPIYGHAYFGILPRGDGKIVGLSKYDRIVNHFARRLQSQEELVKQIGEFVVETTEPQGLIVRISAVHMCKTHRGVAASRASRMVSTYSYGDMRTDDAKRREFLQECMGRDPGA